MRGRHQPRRAVAERTRWATDVDMSSDHKKPSLTSLVVFAMLLAVLYVLSYAPVVRVRRVTHVLRPDEIVLYATATEQIPCPLPFRAYRPVDWMIDNTPLRKPLFVWAGLWGTREEFELAASIRDAGPPTRIHMEPVDVFYLPNFPQD
jgi:hypothetical protein